MPKIHAQSHLPCITQATYILVTRNGHLWAGKEDQPHPTSITINLNGTRQTPGFAIAENFNLGSKVRGCGFRCGREFGYVVVGGQVLFALQQSGCHADDLSQNPSF